MFQMAVALLCLAYAGLLLRLRTYLLSIIFASFIAIAISAVLPAASAWPYYAPTVANSPHITPALNNSWLVVLCGLRDGSFRTLMALGSEGIISFPSMHAACAVILIITLWPIAILRWVMLALNLAMLVATLIDGSHYFTDVLGGVALGVVCFYVANAIATMPMVAEREGFEPKAAGMIYSILVKNHFVANALPEPDVK
jgi:membrane-associated phospholipid phosphatase